jgi:peptidoglycan hydrolase-like protein with peptidoglycan-binding domain
MTLRQRATVSTPARIALAGASVVAVLATSLGQAPLASATPVATITPTATTATTAPATVAPAAPRGLPSAIEPLAAYVAASSCDTRDKPGTIAVGQLLKATYPGTTYGISRSCGSDALPTSEHYDGRAVDWFTNVRTATGKARGNALVSWLTAKDARGNVAANARRLGVMYIIWNNRIWGAYNPAAGWKPYSSCATHPAAASDTTCHRNHVHLSLSWEGAMRRTSWWTKTVARQDFGPCRVRDLNWAPAYARANPVRCTVYPRVYAASGASALNRSLVTYSGMALRTGSAGPAVTAVQRAVGTGADGGFGPQTAATVRKFQAAHRLSTNGLVDVPTWRALLKATAHQAAPKPATKAAPKARYAAYEKVVLKIGMRTTTVKVLQKALGLKLVDGDFGPQTKAAVVAFQKKHHLTANGIVTTPVWRAFG